MTILAACDVEARRSAGEQHKQALDRAEPSGPRSDPARLPEDEEAGLRAQAEWREHLTFEEEERQLMFDRQRLKAHAAIVALARGARARYDAVRSEGAALTTQKTIARQMRELRQRVHKLDPWGVNSRLREDYAWLAATLEGPYADAVLASLAGHGERRAQLGAEFDGRMEKIADWLRKAAESEEEGESEREREVD